LIDKLYIDYQFHFFSLEPLSRKSILSVFCIFRCDPRSSSALSSWKMEACSNHHTLYETRIESQIHPFRNPMEKVWKQNKRTRLDWILFFLKKVYY
jgi:hypothetical protein